MLYISLNFFLLEYMFFFINYNNFDINALKKSEQ